MNPPPEMVKPDEVKSPVVSTPVSLVEVPATVLVNPPAVTKVMPPVERIPVDSRA